jgi:hypothetical protein
MKTLRGQRRWRQASIPAVEEVFVGEALGKPVEQGRVVVQHSGPCSAVFSLVVAVRVRVDLPP